MMKIQDDVLLLVQPVEPMPQGGTHGTFLIYHREGGGSIQKEPEMIGIKRLVNRRKALWLWSFWLVRNQRSDRLNLSSRYG
jgi:hypothetical protein